MDSGGRRNVLRAALDIARRALAQIIAYSGENRHSENRRRQPQALGVLLAYIAIARRMARAPRAAARSAGDKLYHKDAACVNIFAISLLQHLISGKSSSLAALPRCGSVA